MALDLQEKGFEQLSNAVRYYRWFSDIVAPWVGNRILEVGCGHGNVTINFLDRAYIHGIDLNVSYLEHIKRRFASHKNFHGYLADITDEATLKKLSQEKFDTIIACNVMEHIEDDLKTATDIYSLLQPGGHFIIQVPAFEWLMSPYDKNVGHYRRYTKKSAQALLSDAGFKIVYARYFNALGVIAWLWRFKICRGSDAGEQSVKLLELLVPVLKFMERALPVPFGISVICIGEK